MRVGDLSETWRDSKELCIELIRAIKDSPRSHIVWGRDIALIQTRIKFFGREKPDRLAFMDQVVPELFEVGGAGHADGHPNNRILLQVARM